MKLIVGMAEMSDGKKKVSEGGEAISNGGLVDRAAFFENYLIRKYLKASMLI